MAPRHNQGDGKQVRAYLGENGATPWRTRSSAVVVKQANLPGLMDAAHGEFPVRSPRHAVAGVIKLARVFGRGACAP